MTITPTNPIVPGVAGTPLASAHSADTARAARARNEQKQQAVVERAAQSAAGVAETDGQSMRPGDRDVDGRQAWRFSEHTGDRKPSHDEQPTLAPHTDGDPPNQIDLTG